MTNNISHDSPCFIGFQPDKHLPKADVGLLVDVDVPWFPSDVQANENAFWAHIDIDVLKPASPMWTFPGNLRMQGDSARILEQVLDELKARATPNFKQAAAARVDAAHRRARRPPRARQEARRRQGQAGRDQSALSVRRARQGCSSREDLVFNEGVRNAGAALMQIRRPLPGTMMRSAAAGSAGPAPWRSAPSSPLPSG